MLPHAKCWADVACFVGAYPLSSTQRQGVYLDVALPFHCPALSQKHQKRRQLLTAKSQLWLQLVLAVTNLLFTGSRALIYQTSTASVYLPYTSDCLKDMTDLVVSAIKFPDHFPRTISCS